MKPRDRSDRLLRIFAAGDAESRGRWAKARNRVEECRAASGALAAERDDAAGEIRAVATGRVDLERLRLADESREGMAARLARANDVTRAADRAADAAKETWEAAHRRVRALEKFGERLAAHAEAERRAADARGREEVRPPTTEAP